MEIYHRTPSLQSGSVRLLKLEPIPAQQSTLRCRLDVFELATSPSYCALSYTWGSPWPAGFSPKAHPDDTLTANSENEPAYNANQQWHVIDSTINGSKDAVKCLIICNDAMVWVTQNLFDFLSHCSKTSTPESKGYIWVDALCINQRDLNERSHQLTLMAEIYKHASKVIVWLGVEDAYTAQAIGLVGELADLTASERSSLRPERVENHERWVALGHFFQRRWFNRAWIIQEVFFAQAITVLCGTRTVSWKDMITASRYISTSSWAPLFKDWEMSGVTNHEPTEGHQLPVRLAAAKRGITRSSGDNLLHALIRCRLSACQDPRDKVYSQLQLGNADIFPTYHASVQEIFTATAVWILEHSDNLLLLCCVEGEEFQRLPQLPSWVPDWSVTESLGLRITGYPQFSAGLRRARKLRFMHSSDRHVLEIEAAKIDEITEAYASKKELRDDPLSAQNLSLFQDHNTHSADILWRTLITNRSSEAGEQKTKYLYPASSQLQESFHKWIMWRIGYAMQWKDDSTKLGLMSEATLRSTATSILPSDSDLKSFMQECIKNPEHYESIASAASLFDVHYTHAMLLRPFKTQQGYFGLGTQCLRRGDSVFIAPGCRVPLILRPTDDKAYYRLVGGSYVHGIMDGEALESPKAEFQMVSLM